jgi:hypothetical protein
MVKLQLTEETGKTPGAIASYHLKEHDFTDIPTAYVDRLGKWITEHNNGALELYQEIEVPYRLEELKPIAFVSVPHSQRDETLFPEQRQFTGWTLTQDKYLRQGSCLILSFQITLITKVGEI